MKKNRSNIILILIFLVGLSVMLYPTVSDYINQKNQSRAVASYSEEVENLSDVDYQAYFDAADDYNRRLAETPDAFYRPEEVSGYTDTLDVSGTGIMGYITISKIGVELPVYHGTSDGVLQVAAGHLEGSSLPVGGAGTHAVISAHRDQISIVLPTETDLLQPVEGKDYVTLMTCTPYGINTHRLLVRGKRIENAENQKHIRVTADALRIEPIIVAPALAVPMLLVMLVVMLAVPHLRKRKNQREENHHEEHP